jgi:putative phosphoribosyl transferase
MHTMQTAPFASRFRDRFAAGRELAQKLAHYRRRDDALLLALPRGGVEVAYAVAEELEMPLDVFVVRKLGVPGHPELAMGAIASGGVRVINHEVTVLARITPQVVDDITRLELAELERREHEYRGDRPPPEVHGRTAILVDDGLATGSTMLAAIQAVWQLGPAGVVVAVPLASVETCQELRNHADEVVCARTPEPFFAVGAWYEDFDQVSDDEVKDLLAKARKPATVSPI